MQGATTNQLMVFHAIVEAGSLRGAARQLNIAPPTVSQALQALERGIGLPVMLRSTRHLELTEAGRMLYQRTRPLLESLSLAVESVRDLGDVPAGKVRLTLPHFVADFFLQPIYADFCRRYPQIELEISLSDAVVNLLSEGFDAGIRFGNLIEDGMVARPLTPPMPEAIFASPEYLAEFGTPVEVADLTKHKKIQYRFISANQIAPMTLLRDGEEVRVDMPTALIVNDTALMVDAAIRGLGIGCMVWPVVAPMLGSGTLLPILPSAWRTIPGLQLFYPQNSQKAKRIRVLIDFLIEHAIVAWPLPFTLSSAEVANSKGKHSR